MKKNMKIAITPEQPLDEVVRELERLGYSTNNFYFDNSADASVVCACRDGDIMDLKMSIDDPKIKKYKLTTLTELKEMG